MIIISVFYIKLKDEAIHVAIVYESTVSSMWHCISSTLLYPIIVQLGIAITILL